MNCDHVHTVGTQGMALEGAETPVPAEIKSATPAMTSRKGAAVPGIDSGDGRDQACRHGRNDDGTLCGTSRALLPAEWTERFHTVHLRPLAKTPGICRDDRRASRVLPQRL